MKVLTHLERPANTAEPEGKTILQQRTRNPGPRHLLIRPCHLILPRYHHHTFLDRRRTFHRRRKCLDHRRSTVIVAWLV